MTASVLLLCGLFGAARAIVLQPSGEDATNFRADNAAEDEDSEDANVEKKPWLHAATKAEKRVPLKLTRHAASAAATISGCEKLVADFAPPEGANSTSNLMAKLASSSHPNSDLWSPCSSLKSGAKFSPELARFLSYQLAPKSAMEFGCGTGTMSDFIARQVGAEVSCIEPERTLDTLMASLRRDHLEPGKLSQLVYNIFSNDPEAAACSKAIVERGHDLVFSLAVAEHLPHHFHKVMVDLLAKSTRKWLVFSAAGPTLEEERRHLLFDDGHIPESSLPKEVWQQIFEMRGLIYMPKLTEMARRATGHLRKDLASSLMVFKHRSNPLDDTDEPVEMLKDFMTDAQGEGEWSQEKANAFADGANAMTWPSLTVMQRQVERGELCSDGPDEAMLLGTTPGDTGAPAQQQQLAKTSAWAAWGAKYKQ